VVREKIEQRLAAAEIALEEAAARLERTQKRLREIDQERATIVGETDIARRAVSDLEAEIAKSREALAAAEVEEARAAVTEAVQRRNEVINDAAAALNTAVDLLEQLRVCRADVVDAQKRLTRLDPANANRTAAPAEPGVVDEPWQRIVSAVKAQLDEDLEIDIVDAAARSNAPSAIDALPEHLRVLAVQRRRELQRASLVHVREFRRPVSP
jgi:chromosome segregation ATPase